MEIQRIIGKKSLTIVVTGEKELAAQIFAYEKFKEVRLDLSNWEVKILMDYDEAYYKVFKIEPSEELPEEKCKEIIIQFYNNLLNSAMRLSEQEMKNLQNQHNENMKKIERENETK